MVNRALKQATQELRMFNFFSLDSLIDESQKVDQAFITQQSDVASGNPLIAELRQLVVETQQGALTSDKLIEELVRLDGEFQQEGLDSIFATTIFPYFDGRDGLPLGDFGSIKDIMGPQTSINEGTLADRNQPTISVYQVMSSRISPTHKNTEAVSIFLNAIPTVEMSRAVPFLNISFQTSRPPVANNQVNSLSLTKFLEGAKNINELGSADQTLVRANSALVEQDDEDKVVGASGMELFTMPQTLINAEPDNDITSRLTPIIDKFRPLASIQQFQVDVTPAPGLMNYRTAKLKFIIHDRSRLHEFADFIKPDMYNQTEILIEYGWSHPDGNIQDGGNLGATIDNPFGAFINALKVKEKYQVKNNSFAFKENGEVVVDLELYTKGAQDFYVSNIADNDDIGKTQVEIQRLQEKIGELRNRLFNKQDKRFTKEIRGAQIFNAASDGNSELRLTKELRRELKRTLKSLGKEGAGETAKQLRQSLIDLYGDPTKGGEGSESKKLEQSIGKAINDKMAKIKRGDSQTFDPFIFVADPTRAEENKGLENVFVSLAKVFLLFVVEPLAVTGKFDDIQVLFYRFNNNAGLIGGPFGPGNIGAFAIDIDNFGERYKKLATSKRTANLTLRDFIQFLNSAFVEDASNVNYGMRKLYIENTKRQSGTPKPKKKYRDTNTMVREIEKIMRCEAGIEDGVFKMPHLDVFVECVPADTNEQGKSNSVGDGQTVLRIHVFDKQATVYTTQQAMLSAKRDTDISTIGDVPITQEINKATQSERDQAQAILDQAIQTKLLQEVPGTEGAEKVYEVKGGPRELKEFISNTMPVIIYGANNTAITDAGLKSQTDNKLSTINMLRAGDAGPLSPNGAAQGGLPMQLLPAKMDLRMIGCPVVEYAQQFFVDMQTGTTVDDIYTVTKIQHTIEPGKFVTTMGMVPLVAYGKYFSMVQKAGAAVKILGQMLAEDDSQKPEGKEKDEDC